MRYVAIGLGDTSLYVLAGMAAALFLALGFPGVPEAVPFEHARAELLPPGEPFGAVSA